MDMGKDKLPDNRDIDTEGGNYNENIGKNYIQAHHVTIIEGDNYNHNHGILQGKNSYELGETVDKSIEPNSIYIERPPVETSCYQAIKKPGVLIRIKAPQRMGKTMLLAKVLEHGRELNYHTVNVNFKLAESEILSDYQTFLQWLCVEVADSLELPDRVEEKWRSIFGLNRNCTRYWQKYLLPNLDHPVVFAMDSFEGLFDYPELFKNFCNLLRGWYELAKQEDKIGKMWQKVRFVVVHSTEKYPQLDTNCSPFNVGIPIELGEFNQQQVETLAQHYDVGSKVSLPSLMGLVGGHTELLNQAFAALKQNNITSEKLLELASTEEGIFRNHLHQQLFHLQHNLCLEAAYKRVVLAGKSIPLDAEVGFKLHSLGLIKFQGNNCIPSCSLYQQYFGMRLL